VAEGKEMGWQGSGNEGRVAPSNWEVWIRQRRREGREKGKERS